MKLWITGARGFIGRHARRIAEAAGHRVTAIDLRAEPGDTALDLDDPGAVTALVRAEKPDAVIHLAWYAAPEDYLRSEQSVASLRTTLAFAGALFGAASTRLVGVGTCLEYANLPRARAESDETAPESLYARCKHAAHLVVEEMARQKGASFAWARLFHMHGPGEHNKRLIPAVIDALRQGRPFSLSPGDQLRDHLDVRDVAGALVHLATCDVQGTVNVCSGNAVTLRSVLEAVGRAVGRPELLRFGERPYQAGEVMNLTGDATRLYASGFRPEHADLDKSIADAVGAR